MGDVPAQAKTRTTRQLRRWAEGFLFVAAWMALGWGFRLSTDAYLLAGVPLTIAFQLLVRRAPLRALWVREAPRARDGTLVVGAALAILPAYYMMIQVRDRAWVAVAWFACAVAGAFAAGYALRAWRRESWRALAFGVLTAGTIGVAQMVLARLAQGARQPILPLVGLRDFALYFPVCFVLEEVTFRGALDAHLHHPSDRRRMLSAVLGGAAWGLWHLPTLRPEDRTAIVALELVFVHATIGVPLAISWRWGGNLAAPAFVHATIDGVRNALRILR